MTKLILLGTGTPNACPYNSGPSVAVVVDDNAYLVDFGPGVVRQCSKVYFKGIKQLHPKNLKVAFCTHLHSDHTLGLADLIFTPWVLEREEPLRLIGPVGLKQMSDYLTKAYSKDIDMRINGLEKANLVGFKTIVEEILLGKEDYGVIYKDDLVSVEAFSTKHGDLQSLAYKFITKDKTIVISGDTCPLDIMADKAKDVDILVHEVEYAKGLMERSEKWQVYHKNVHTLSSDLASILIKARPKLTVTYHRIYHIDTFSDDALLQMEVRKKAILKEIKDAGYDGEVINGEDLDIF